MRNTLLRTNYSYKWDNVRKNTVMIRDDNREYWATPHLAQLNKGKTNLVPIGNMPKMINAQTMLLTSSTELTFENSDSYGVEVSYSPTAGLTPSIEECEYVNWYIKVTTSSPHGLAVNDVVTFSTPGSVATDGEVAIVSYVIDETSYYFHFDEGASAVMSYFYSSSGSHVCFYGNQELGVDLLEVYKNEKQLVIGEDYEISMDDGSTWFNDWPTVATLNTHFYRKAGAGRFYVKLLDYDRSNVYWTKYLVKRNQQLTSCKQINLKNGRVVFDEGLKFTSGMLQPIIISRSYTANPYVAVLIRNYYLAIQARKLENNPTANIQRENVKVYLSGDTINGS